MLKKTWQVNKISKIPRGIVFKLSETAVSSACEKTFYWRTSQQHVMELVLDALVWCVSKGDGNSSTKSYCLPHTILHLTAGKVLSCYWAQCPTWKASSSTSAEQEDLLHISLSHELTAPQRIEGSGLDV